MKRLDFLRRLGEELDGLPREDVSRSLSYYDEMILDRMEDGVAEEEAVAAVGAPAEIATEILSEMPFKKIIKRIKSNVSKKKIRAWEISLIILGSPIWLSLLITMLALVISAFAVIWSIAISYIALTASLVAIGAAGIILFFPVLFMSGLPAGLIHLGIGVFSAGLGLLLILATKHVICGVGLLSKKIIVGIKLCFIKGVRK